MEILRNNDIALDKWEALIKVSKQASPFQTPSFLNFFNSTENYSAEVFALTREESIRSLAVVTIQKEKGIKSYFSSRGIIYGGPLLYENNSDDLFPLLEYIANHYQKRLIYIEIRNFFDYSFYQTTLQKKGWKFLPYLNITINTEKKSLADLLSEMKYNRRREIKLSLEKNVKYRECKNKSELLSLYQILKDLYKTRVKLPLPGIDYFNHLWKSEIGKIFVVIDQEKVIGGSFCAVLEGNSIYTMFYCGLRNYDKKIFPTHLAVLAALNYGVESGCKHFDFMGVGIKGDEYGVRGYKQEFGGNLNEFGRYRLILNPFMFKIGELGIKVLQKISK